MRRLLAILSVALVWGTALPAGAVPPVTETTVEHDLVEIFVDFFTCDEGDLYEITVTSTLIDHVTVFPDGRLHGTFTQTGTFDAVPLDPADQPASGRFAIWGGFNDNGRTLNGTFTFNVHGTYEDGSRISTHFVGHFHERPDGTASFFERCRD